MKLASLKEYAETYYTPMSPKNSLKLIVLAFLISACAEPEREDVIARFPGGEKQVVAFYKGDGTDETLIERRTYDASGELILLEDVVEGIIFEWAAVKESAGGSCIAFGPLTGSDANLVKTLHERVGVRADLRTGIGQIFVGHWVQIRNISDPSAVKAILSRLQGIGFVDAYLMRNDDGGLSISLGLFGDLKKAEEIKSQVEQLDLSVDIVPRTLDGEVYYVDVGLPPGRDASATIKKFWESTAIQGHYVICDIAEEQEARKSEEKQKATKLEKYQACISRAAKRARQACATDPCDVGCRLLNTGNYSSAVSCINACQNRSPEEKLQLCEDAAYSVETNARLECPL